jgi:hypothetical protein
MKQHKLNSEEIDLIINAAYNDLSIINKIRVYLLINKNEEAKRIYDEYKETAESVKEITQYEMSEELEHKIKNRIGIKPEEQRSFLTDLYSLIIMKPVAASLTAVLLIITISTSVVLNNNRTIESNNYSQAEIEMAELQTKQALEMVSSILTSTSNKVRKDILKNTVSSEINKGINIVNQLFIEGEKNEN